MAAPSGVFTRAASSSAQSYAGSNRNAIGDDHEKRDLGGDGRGARGDDMSVVVRAHDYGDTRCVICNAPRDMPEAICDSDVEFRALDGRPWHAVLKEDGRTRIYGVNPAGWWVPAAHATWDGARLTLDRIPTFATTYFPWLDMAALIEATAAAIRAPRAQAVAS